MKSEILIPRKNSAENSSENPPSLDSIFNRILADTTADLEKRRETYQKWLGGSLGLTFFLKNVKTNYPYSPNRADFLYGITDQVKKKLIDTFIKTTKEMGYEKQIDRSKIRKYVNENFSKIIKAYQDMVEKIIYDTNSLYTSAHRQTSMQPTKKEMIQVAQRGRRSEIAEANLKYKFKKLFAKVFSYDNDGKIVTKIGSLDELYRIKSKLMFGFFGFGFGTKGIVRLIESDKNKLRVLFDFLDSTFKIKVNRKASSIDDLLYSALISIVEEGSEAYKAIENTDKKRDSQNKILSGSHNNDSNDETVAATKPKGEDDSPDSGGNLKTQEGTTKKDVNYKKAKEVIKGITTRQNYGWLRRKIKEAKIGQKIFRGSVAAGVGAVAAGVVLSSGGVLGGAAVAFGARQFGKAAVAGAFAYKDVRKRDGLNTRQKLMTATMSGATVFAAGTAIGYLYDLYGDNIKAGIDKVVGLGNSDRMLSKATNLVGDTFIKGGRVVKDGVSLFTDKMSEVSQPFLNPTLGQEATNQIAQIETVATDIKGMTEDLGELNKRKTELFGIEAMKNEELLIAIQELDEMRKSFPATLDKASARRFSELEELVTRTTKEKGAITSQLERVNADIAKVKGRIELAEQVQKAAIERGQDITRRIKGQMNYNNTTILSKTDANSLAKGK